MIVQLVFNKNLLKKSSTWQISTKLHPTLYRLYKIFVVSSNTFQYFSLYFILITASKSHLEVLLLPTHNIVFLILFAILLRYRNNFLKNLIHVLHMDNIQIFRSHIFEDYRTAT